ncbi:MAG: MFS transporter [Gammaproteobacteria bacterium]|nr:MFS transporter [Gammaproteobacteria bacterium]
MAEQQQLYRFGPIDLAPGIRPMHVSTKLWAAFIGVAMLSGISFLQGYVLTEHLHIPRNQQGTVSGDLSFWVEVVAIFLFTPVGVLADRIGRRPVYICGIIIMGIGYGLVPYATSVAELMVFRLVITVGMAAVAGTLATLTNDYPMENSRGKLIGITSMANILGTILMSVGIARIPSFLAERGYDAVTGGKAMFLAATLLCMVTAVVARFGLKSGTPVARRERASTRTLLTSGLRAGRNSRIALSYAAAFAARSDLVIKGLFLVLWAIQDGMKQGMNPGESMARFGVMMAIMSGTSLAAAPFFGWFMDRVNRVTATIVALTFATVGYLSMGIITSPLDFAMIPYFLIISLGSSFMLKASLGLIGQEAPPKERGSVIATNSLFGALGILIFTVVGGRLFDAWGPWAPFVIAGVYQVFLLAVAIIVRIVSPGISVEEQRQKQKQMSAAITA